ncbi:MAG: hypothetical protein AAFN10_28355, partial [Bacteroidota bacterium]
MLIFQISFLLISFSFVIPAEQPQALDAHTHSEICTPCDLFLLTDNATPQAALTQLSQGQLVFEDTRENEECFFDLLDNLVSMAISDSD